MEDYYSGSVMPKRSQTSGKTVVEQVRACENNNKPFKRWW